METAPSDTPAAVIAPPSSVAGAHFASSSKQLQDSHPQGPTQGPRDLATQASWHRMHPAEFSLPVSVQLCLLSPPAAQCCYPCGGSQVKSGQQDKAPATARDRQGKASQRTKGKVPGGLGLPKLKVAKSLPTGYWQSVVGPGPVWLSVSVTLCLPYCTTSGSMAFLTETHCHLAQSDRQMEPPHQHYPPSATSISMRLCSKSSQPTRSLHRILGCPASHRHRTPVPHLTTTAFDFDLVNLDRQSPAFCQSPSVPRPFIPCAWLYSNPRTAINPGVRTSHLLDLRYILAGPDPVSPAQNRYLTSGPGRPGRPVTFANHPPGPGFGVTTFSSSSSQTPRRLLCPLASQPASQPTRQGTLRRRWMYTVCATDAFDAVLLHHNHRQPTPPPLPFSTSPSESRRLRRQLPSALGFPLTDRKHSHFPPSRTLSPPVRRQSVSVCEPPNRPADWDSTIKPSDFDGAGVYSVPSVPLPLVPPANRLHRHHYRRQLLVLTLTLAPGPDCGPGPGLPARPCVHPRPSRTAYPSARFECH